MVSACRLEHHRQRSCDGFDIDVLKDASFDEQESVRVAHLQNNMK